MRRQEQSKPLEKQSAEATPTSRRSIRAVRTGPVSEAELAVRRARIMAMAGEEFLARGFDGASIDRIARMSNVSKATIYADYGDKRQLFESAFKSMVRSFRVGLEAALVVDRPFEDTIKAIVRATVEGLDDENLSLVRLAIGERTRFPALAEVVLAQSIETIGLLSKYIDQACGRSIGLEESRRKAFNLMHMALGGYATLLGSPRDYFNDSEAWISSISFTFLNGFGDKV